MPQTMQGAKQIELVDELLYMYIAWGWITMILAIVFLFIVFRNWQHASSAATPSQYNLRHKYLISMILTILSALVYGIVVVFGINDSIIPWNFDKLPSIYLQVLIFFLVFSGFSFMCSTLVSFVIRIAILYEQLTKLQSVLVNLFSISIMFVIVVAAIVVSLDGVDLGHFHDKSSGISVLRALEKSVAIIFTFIMLPLTIIGFVLFAFVYSYKLKLLKQISNKKERDVLMPIVLKESMLVLVACAIFMSFGVCIVLIPDDNVQLFATMTFGCMLICSFFMFQFNHRAFYKLCYYPSLCWLNVCCFHAKNEHDAQLLRVQSVLHGGYDMTKREESDVEDETDDQSDREALNADDL